MGLAFESLSDKLQNIFKNLRGKGRLTEEDVKAALKEVKIALLEADVNFKVVKDFVKKVNERAVGQDVMNSLTPGQMVIKIVNEELTNLMGSETTELKLLPDNQITVIMMMGLQGAGKTTTTAKIAGKLKAKGKRPLLVACDVYRPAAIEQLKINGEKQQVPVFSMGDKQKPLNIAKAAIEHAKKNNNNVVILDTAGRLHVDEDMMNELVEIRDNIELTQTVLVVDAMTGQDAVNVAKEFNEKIGIDGIIVTKLDGDTRGGAALSIKAITGKPILYIGMGEKLSDLEQFHPDRMASRILGMGDVLSLIEKAVDTITTQVIVDKNDPGFKNPTKPIGSFYTKEEAEKLEKDKGYTMKEDAGRGYRRVVASPKPVDIVEKEAIKTMVDSGFIVIACGGGGIPVVEDGDRLEGVPAVIDKDFAAEKLAEILDADALLILTAVDRVCVNFNKPDQKALKEINLEEVDKYIEEGQFAPGSMLPKVEACKKFVLSGDKKVAIIASLTNAKAALRGESGTKIVK